jgi:hypothetical protein
MMIHESHPRPRRPESLGKTTTRRFLVPHAAVNAAWKFSMIEVANRPAARRIQFRSCRYRGTSRLPTEADFIEVVARALREFQASLDCKVRKTGIVLQAG